MTSLDCAEEAQGKATGTMEQGIGSPQEFKERVTDLVRNKKTQLPTLPIVVTNVLKVVADEKSSTRDLSDLINQDQALTNKILRLANSPYYGRIGRIDSILRAITIIGFNEVVSLTIGISVFSVLQLEGASGLLNMKDLWLHAIGSSFAAREITRRLSGAKLRPTMSGRRQQLEDRPIFLSTLLHDMGKVILCVYFPAEYREVMIWAKQNKAPLEQAEMDLLGLDHTHMAGLIMRIWNFPDTIAYPVRFHHRSEKCPADHRTGAMMVELANYVTHKSGIGRSGTFAIKFPAAAAQQFELERNVILEISESLKELRSEIDSFFSFLP